MHIDSILSKINFRDARTIVLDNVEPRAVADSRNLYYRLLWFKIYSKHKKEEPQQVLIQISFNQTHSVFT